MAQTGNLKVSYDFSKTSLSLNSTSFKNAVKDIFSWHFIEGNHDFNPEAPTDPKTHAEEVAEDLAEVIEAYIKTAQITIPSGTINSSGAVTNPAVIAGGYPGAITVPATLSTQSASAVIGTNLNVGGVD